MIARLTTVQSHVLLEQAWKDRHAYEMLLAAPAFRLRYVYMDHEEDTVYALTESSVTSREEHLLVFHKYTGSLLLRLPVCAFPHIAVGAGYVAVSQYAKGASWDTCKLTTADIDENGPGEATKLGAVTIYRTARAACRAAANWNGVKKEWKPRGLPLEYYMTLDHLQECRAMNVGFVNGEGVLVAASKETRTLYMFYLDTGRRAEFAYSMGPAWDTALPDERVPEVSVSEQLNIPDSRPCTPTTSTCSLLCRVKCLSILTEASMLSPSLIGRPHQRMSLPVSIPFMEGTHIPTGLMCDRNVLMRHSQVLISRTRYPGKCTASALGSMAR